MTLTLTSRGQLTFRKEVLQHLGLKPGDRLEVDLLPGQKVGLRASRGTKSIREVYGMLAGLTDKVATLEEIKEATEKGWAGLL